MTLREFIEQEIREGHVFDIAEFGTKLYILEFEDGEEIQPEEFEDYLDYNLDSASIVHTFGSHFHLMHYEILIAYDGEKPKKETDAEIEAEIEEEVEKVRQSINARSKK